MTRTPVLVLLILVGWCVVPARAEAADISDDVSGSAASGMHCTERLPLPFLPNVIDAKWSPDSTKLAIVWFSRVPSLRNVSGYHEEEILDTVDVATGKVRPLGVGDRPQWSGSGRYVSYWGPNADELRVVRDDGIVARLAPTIPEVRWAGDTLFFIEKNTIRIWQEGAVQTVTVIPSKYVPRYPRDDVHFSGDGELLTLSRYLPDGEIERYLGSTETGLFAPLDTGSATYTEWAPAGSTLLVRYADRIAIRDLTALTATMLPIARGTVHAWSADGRSLLLGRVSPTVPGGDALDTFAARWPQAKEAAATLPNLIGARTFSPNGLYFTGVSRDGRQDTRLEVYRCGITRSVSARSDPGAPARLERIAAGGRLVRPAAGDIAQFMQGSHTGIDIAAPFGSLVVAADDGTVTATGWITNGGDRVCVAHAAGLETCYFHTSSALVALGERVASGQPIALVGMTGITTGPHVHWEAKFFGRLVDPLGR